MRNSEVSRVIAAARQEAWALMPEKLAQIEAFLHARLNGSEISAADREAYLLKAEQQQRYQQQGSIAVIPVFGVIAQRMSLMGAISGGTSTEALTKQIQQAASDPSISSIILNFDTPGGAVSGTPEAFAAIMEARAQKPVIGFANALAASAGYWLISACSEIVSTPSGMVGSIGVLMMHEDVSAAAEKDGVKVTFITAGKYKAEGNQFEPLSDEARANLQSKVDAAYSMFVKDIAKGRGITSAQVKSDYGEGRVLMASDAKAAGMIDRIETMDQTISRLSRAGKPSNSRKALGEVMDMAAKVL
jgi:capsid assembly protease